MLLLIRQVVQAAQRAKIEVSLCGEIASEVEYAPLLLGFGLRTISLAPLMIPEMKKVIRSLSMGDCERIARSALSFDTSKQTINYLREELRKVKLLKI